MTTSSQVTLLAQDIGAKLRATRLLLNAAAGDNSQLLTNAKGNLVASINELHGLIVAGAAVIDDTSTANDKAWSAEKIQQVADASAEAARQTILGGVPETFDTLIELMQEIQTNEGDVASALTSIAANTALITTAQATADGAVSDAAAAQTTADGAVTAAGTAQTTADGAQTTADAASTAAANAQTSANAAQATADTATSDLALLTTAVGDTNADFVATFQSALAGT